jgi:Flp pilus assembly protein TadG
MRRLIHSVDRREARGERGQVLAIFALSLVAIVAMTGLVLDGGSTFVQRRDMQNTADAAALAAAYSYAMTGSTSGAASAGQSTAASNGYVNGTSGVTVTISNTAANPGWTFTATVSKPHGNSFSGLLGMPSWPVTTTASSEAGRPNAALGALPIIFNQQAFNNNGSGPNNVMTYSEPDSGSNDIPWGSNKFNWTMYCNNCNADSSSVDALINQGGQATVVTLDDHISPLNAGSHATLYSDLSNWIGGEFPVPVVDDSGNMVGWAMFHLTGSVGGSTKQISGYFVSPINPAAMTVVPGVNAGGDFGAYYVALTN